MEAVASLFSASALLKAALSLSKYSVHSLSF